MAVTDLRSVLNLAGELWGINCVDMEDIVITEPLYFGCPHQTEMKAEKMCF